MANTPAPPAQPQGQPPAQQGAPADEEQRFAAIEAEQKRQGGMLETIVEKLGGTAKTGAADAHAQGAAGTETYLSKDEVIAEATRKAVEAVGAQAADAAHQADHDKLRTPPPEHQPRERNWRTRMQGRLYGGDPS